MSEEARNNGVRVTNNKDARYGTQSMYVRRKEANEPEVSINVVNVPWTLVQPSRDGRRKTSVSISGLRRKIIKKKQAVRVPWYKRRRLLPIEALPADDQRH